MTNYQKKGLEKFIKIRRELINKLDLGILNKREFLFQNYMLITSLSIKPYLTPDTISKCIYNYQYYNILAKYAKAFPSKKKSKSNLNIINEYYRLKDLTILYILDNKDLGEIIAYPIKLESKRLNNNLFEIILLDHEKVILHSLNDEIKEKLIALGSYDKRPRESFIDSYVNKTY